MPHTTLDAAGAVKCHDDDIIEDMMIDRMYVSSVRLDGYTYGCTAVYTRAGRLSRSQDSHRLSALTQISSVSYGVK